MNARDTLGRTPLHLASAASGTIPTSVLAVVMPTLVDAGAYPNVRDSDGRNPLDYALENRSLEGLAEVRPRREAMGTPSGGAGGTE